MIDTHMHLGTSRFTGHTTTETELLAAMEQYGITHGLVMPQPTLESLPKVHRRIYELTQAFPSRLFGMASIDPWLSEEEYEREFACCVRQYGFVAVKLHPLGHNISPLAPQCDKIYQCARLYNIPVIVHTGLGTPNSLPALMIEPARRYPDVFFILAHAGFAVYSAEAIVAAMCCDNILLEPSWTPIFSVREMIKRVGIERMLFGSDHLENIPVELAKFNALNLSDREREHLFFQNPNRIFRLGL